MTDDANLWGPWRKAVGDPERAPQFRCLATLAKVFLFDRSDLVEALKRAETDDEAAERAFQMLLGVPTKQRRNIIATFGGVTYGAAGRAPSVAASAPTAP